MNPAWRDDLRLIANILQYCGSAPSAEIITRIVGSLSEKEAWDVIAEAKRIGMIEPVEVPVEPTIHEGMEWRLVRGFDMTQLEIHA